MIHIELSLVVKELVQRLIDKEYEIFYQIGMSGEYNSKEIEELINDYGGKLTNPLVQDYEDMDIYEIDDEPEYVIEYDLWVDGQKSDLTLPATIRFAEGKETSISIDNIHVM